MEINQAEQITMMLCAIQTGVCVWFFYELIRLCRLLTGTTAASCFFQDVFFCVFASLITFFAFLGFSDGNIYPYLLFGECIGFCIPYFTIGRILHAVLEKIIRGIAHLFRPIKRWGERCGEKVRKRVVIVLFRFRDILFLKIRKMRKKIKKIQKKS